MVKRILFLFSDTGGGHRAASNAIIEALDQNYPGQFQTTMVDFLRNYSPPPLRNSPEIYPSLSRIKGAWKFSFEAANGPRRSRALSQITYPYLRHWLVKLIDENPADLIISLHPISGAVVPRVIRGKSIPFFTVVTDLITTHAFWYSPGADLIILPTEQARNRGIRLGADPQIMRVIGQPVSPAFAAITESKTQLRPELGWSQDNPVVLLIGGGDGLGPLRRVVSAINQAELPITLAVVCGRNQALLNDLGELDWKIPYHLYGFTTEMPRLMRAADIIVTKAGSETISEAFISGLPIVMYACLPGQEEGNIDYVLDAAAGLWAPTTERVVSAVRLLASNRAILDQMSAASSSLAHPHAACHIADIIADQLV